jgi:hypothetical protein
MIEIFLIFLKIIYMHDGSHMNNISFELFDLKKNTILTKLIGSKQDKVGQFVITLIICEF